jgi:hypothetical protein
MYDKANDKYYSELPYFFWPKDALEVEGVGAHSLAKADIKLGRHIREH